MSNWEATPEMLMNLVEQARDQDRPVIARGLADWAEDLRKERRETYLADKVAMVMWERTRRDGDIPWGAVYPEMRDKWIAAAMAALREVEKQHE